MPVFAYHVRGLDCAEEMAALRATVGRLPGVTDLSFDLLDGTMRLEADPSVVNDPAVLAAVREARLEAVRIPPGGAVNSRGPKQTFWAEHGRLLACAGSAVFTAAAFLVHAVWHGGLRHALAAGEEVPPHIYPLPVILLYGLAVVIGGWFIAPKAWSAIRQRRADMNLLMTIAVLGAIGIGQWFEAASVTALFSLALWLESWSVGRARRAVQALMTLSPPTARVVGEDDRSEIEHPVEDVLPGARVAVRPGERIPLDGVILEGATTINQAPITGESIPVVKQPGDEVFAGTINNEGAIRFRVLRPARDTTLARILRMVEDARQRRAPVEQAVERFARYYTPAVMVMAALVLVIPPLAGHGAWGDWFYRALVWLVMACPCALVIATPVSLVASLTAAARKGVLIKGGVYLEIPASLRAVALDKTGTLTNGHPEVQAIIPLDNHTPVQLLATAAGLESQSDHPLARAVLRRAAAGGVAPRPASDHQAVPGKGVYALIEGRRYWIGNHRWLHEMSLEDESLHRRLESLEDEGHSVVIIGQSQHVCGLMTLADELRPGARAAVRRLKALGIRQVTMLTGDNEGTAAAIARAAGVDSFRAELLPGEKQEAVGELSRRYGPVAMIGDGVNDAPALAAAAVGIAMGAAGTDAALETADIALMSDELSRVPWLIRHSRRTRRVIRANLIIALGIKAVFMVLAALGRATLWMAIAADMGASLLVISHGLRLRHGGEEAAL